MVIGRAGKPPLRVLHFDWVIEAQKSSRDVQRYPLMRDEAFAWSRANPNAWQRYDYQADLGVVPLQQQRVRSREILNRMKAPRDTQLWNGLAGKVDAGRFAHYAVFATQQQAQRLGIAPQRAARHPRQDSHQEPPNSGSSRQESPSRPRSPGYGGMDIDPRPGEDGQQKAGESEPGPPGVDAPEGERAASAQQADDGYVDMAAGMEDFDPDDPANAIPMVKQL